MKSQEGQKRRPDILLNRVELESWIKQDFFYTNYVTKIAAYGRWWTGWHMGHEQALKAHQMVRGEVLLPMHWGLFTLAYHGWTEPVERLVAAARKAGTEIVVPKPGQIIDASNPPVLEHWWPGLPWNTAEIDPIAATMMN